MVIFVNGYTTRLGAVPILPNPRLCSHAKPPPIFELGARLVSLGSGGKMSAEPFPRVGTLQQRCWRG